jgi:hypothetical protein
LKNKQNHGNKRFNLFVSADESIVLYLDTMKPVPGFLVNPDGSRSSFLVKKILNKRNAIFFQDLYEGLSSYMRSFLPLK